ncbi:MAG TPA: DUF6624 domain-containing protein [Bacteroidia bacterium]|jgi:hypothetical protein|nr:DUF6624 domain-containing protein [Bacteroidia bacterium]
MKPLIICFVLLFGSVKAQYSIVVDTARTNHLRKMYSFEKKREFDRSKTIALQYCRDSSGKIDDPFMHGLIVSCSNLGQIDTSFLLMRQLIYCGGNGVTERMNMDFQLGPLLKYKDSIAVWQNIADSLYFSQCAINNPAFNLKLSKEILDIYIADAWPRVYEDFYYSDSTNHYNRDSASVAWGISDSINQVRTGQIFDEYGWPTAQMVGFDLSQAIWYPLQHGSDAFQKKYKKLARRAYKRGDLLPNLHAMLVDRMEINHGKKQTYGTQYKKNSNGDWVQFPIRRKCFLKHRLRKMNMT